MNYSGKYNAIINKKKEGMRKKTIITGLGKTKIIHFTLDRDYYLELERHSENVSKDNFYLKEEFFLYLHNSFMCLGNSFFLYCHENYMSIRRLCFLTSFFLN